MGQSQAGLSYDPETIETLRKALSSARFNGYLARADGDEGLALELYFYNVRLAEAFLYPLGVTEVVFRNAIDEALVRSFGDDWHMPGEFRDQVLNPASRSSLTTAIRRIQSSVRDGVIAALTFDFWSNLFRREYADLWRSNVYIAFPALSSGVGRGSIHNLVTEINKFRNRVAHHEPILDSNVRDVLSKMFRLTELRCPVTAEWMRQNTKVDDVMYSRPRPGDSAQS